MTLSYDPDRAVGDGDTLTITVTFSEPVTGTPTIAIDTPGTDLTATAMTGSGAGTVWTFSYDVPAGSEGLATVTIAGVTDLAGNPNATATNNTFTIDKLAADLSVTITGSPEPAPRGFLLTYTITVANGGPYDATGVTLTSNLPSGVTFVGVTPALPVCRGLSSTVTCEIGNLANGADTRVTIETTVDATATGTIINNVLVSGDGSDADTSNNTATEETTVLVGELTYFVTIDEGDLDSTLVTLTDFPDPVFVGNDLTYNLVVSNNGQTSVTGVNLTVNLPSAVDFNTVDARLELVLTPLLTGIPQAITPPIGAKLSVAPADRYVLVRAVIGAVSADLLLEAGECQQAFSTIVCDLGDLPSNQSAAVTIVVTPKREGILNNNAKVAYEGSEAITRASESTTVVRLTDLSITIGRITGPVVAGADLNYTLTATNDGPSEASSVTLTDTLPPGVEFVASSGPSDCTESEGNVECDLGNLRQGESVTVTLPVIIGSSALGSITNAASVVGNEADLDSSNNAVTQSLALDLAADLSIITTHSPGRRTSG